MSEKTKEGRIENRPYFETVKSFADVEITDEGVRTLDFLEASEGMAKILGTLDTKLFTFLQGDLRSQISGVQAVHDENPERCRTLDGLIVLQGGPQHSGVSSLKKLHRGLNLTCRAMQSSRTNPSEEMHTSFRRAYDQVLRPHHSWVVQKFVSMILSTAPNRTDFYARIAQGGSQELLHAKLADWLDGLDKNLRYVSVLLGLDTAEEGSSA